MCGFAARRVFPGTIKLRRVALHVVVRGNVTEIGVQFVRHKAVPERLQRRNVAAYDHHERFSASPGFNIVTLPLKHSGW